MALPGVAAFRKAACGVAKVAHDDAARDDGWAAHGSDPNWNSAADDLPTLDAEDPHRLDARVKGKRPKSASPALRTPPSGSASRAEPRPGAAAALSSGRASRNRLRHARSAMATVEDVRRSRFSREIVNASGNFVVVDGVRRAAEPLRDQRDAVLVRILDRLGRAASAQLRCHRRVAPSPSLLDHLLQLLQLVLPPFLSAHITGAWVWAPI